MKLVFVLADKGMQGASVLERVNQGCGNYGGKDRLVVISDGWPNQNSMAILLDIGKHFSAYLWVVASLS